MESRCFRAILPGNLSESAMEALEKWGRETCNSFYVESCSDATAVVVTRKAPKKIREFQRLMSTNCKNWGIELPSRRAGWLSLLSEEDAIIAQGSGPKNCTDQNPIPNPEAPPLTTPHVLSNECSKNESPRDELDDTRAREYLYQPCRLRLPVNLLTNKNWTAPDVDYVSHLC